MVEMTAPRPDDMFFTKTNSGGTDNVWFYNMEADGFSLDDKRTALDSTKHESNNLLLQRLTLMRQLCKWCLHK
jgi:hypothetical protein